MASHLHPQLLSSNPPATLLMQVSAPSFRLEGPSLPNPQATQRTPYLKSPSENSPSKWIQAQPSPPYSGWPQYSKQTSFQNFLVKSLRPISDTIFFKQRMCVSQETEETTSLPLIPKILGRSYIKMTKQKMQNLLEYLTYSKNF